MDLDVKPPGEDSSTPLSDLDSSSDSDAPNVEWLATGRSRRATAGNRMKSMLANEEEPDSDLELLFAEQGDDQGFSDAEAGASDDQMDSSSDSDDDKDADDLEGEKELEKRAKEKRAAQRKRKAQEAIPAKFRKKVRIDTPAQPQQPAPRPKKKSERASWLPSAADMPTRASSRSTTRISKEQLHQQMEERERKRLKQLAQMEKKAAKLAAMKKPPMTQEERLREAAIVEERNSKSLNRWEEAEKVREEERRAKLAALSQRTLSGPFITFWSGVGKVGDGWLNSGFHFMLEEKPKKKPKAKKQDAATAEAVQAKEEPQAANAAQANKADTEKKDGESNGDNSNAAGAPTDAEKPSDAEAQPKTDGVPTENCADEKMDIDVPKANEVNGATHSENVLEPESTKPVDSSKPAATEDAEMAEAPTTQEQTKKETTEPSKDTAIKDSVEQPTAEQQSKENSAEPPKANETEESKETTTEKPKESSAAPTANAELPAAAVSAQPALAEAPTSADTPTSLPANSQLQATLPPTEDASKPTSQIPSEAVTPNPEQAANDPQEATTHSAIMYQNFDDNALKDKAVQTQILFGRKMSKLPSKYHCTNFGGTQLTTRPIAEPPPAAVCPITNMHARYRDPKTDLPFYSTAAYRELKRLETGEYKFSGLLGAWVGNPSYAARGVPERFLSVARCPTQEEVERIERKKVEREQRIKAEAEAAKQKEKEKAEAKKQKDKEKQKEKEKPSEYDAITIKEEQDKGAETALGAGAADTTTPAAAPAPAAAV